MNRVLILGNGPAAHRLCERLVARGHPGNDITVLGAERTAAYNRILLTSVLADSLPPEAAALPELDADVRLGVLATEVDRARHVVRTDTGAVYRYDTLVLATGARPRIPRIPGLRAAGGRLAEGVSPLRTLADHTRIPRFADNCVVLGGGVLGLETAQALRWRGHNVTLVHPHSYPMNRHLDAVGGRLLAERLGESDIDTRWGRKAVSYRVGKLLLDDGESLAADAVVLATGAVPRTGLARRAGLAVRRGVLVDDWLRTTDPDVYAIGDCAEHGGVVPGLITTAWKQAEVLAEVLTGARSHYHGISTVIRPRLRGLDLASIGSAGDLERPDSDVDLVVLSDPARGRYAKLALRREHVTAAVLLGFDRAIATISQLHEQERPVPSDRLSLLLGTTIGAWGAVSEPDEDAVLCHCNTVTQRSLVAAFHDGARDVAALARATRATTGCGSCTTQVRSLCDSLGGAAQRDQG